ncbi:MAG: hypothetical protein CME26_09245 [Gemmatimonadetes bacterium]|nr:hypothetical protein [Gemmatimonadota bacterium]
MDLNLPGNTWMPIDRGQSPERKLAAVRPEKRALEVIRHAGGRVTSPAAVETQDEKLRKTAEEFESIFLFQMLKQVRNAMHKEEFLNGGMAEEMFTGMLDEEYAKVMAKSRSTGIAEVLYQQLSRAHDVEGAPAESMPVATPTGDAVQSRMRRLEEEITAANRAAAASAVQHAATIGHNP